MSDVPLTIALVGPLPPPAGGMANQTRQLAELLIGEGVTVRTIQTQPPYRPAWIGTIPGLRAGWRLLPYLYALWRGCRGAQVVHIMANSGWSWHLFAAPAVWIAKLRGAVVIKLFEITGDQQAQRLVTPAARGLLLEALQIDDIGHDAAHHTALLKDLQQKA